MNKVSLSISLVLGMANGSGDEDMASLPDEIPLSEPSEGQASPDEIPLGVDAVGQEAAAAPSFGAVAAALGAGSVGASQAKAFVQPAAMGPVQLVPDSKAKRSGGRGRGRPRSEGPRLVPGFPAQGISSAASMVAAGLRQDASNAGEPRADLGAGQWLTASLTAENARALAKVPHGQREGLGHPQVLHGFARPPADMEAVAAAAVAHFSDSGQPDEEVQKVVSFFLEGKASAMTSMESLAARLNVARKQLPVLTHRAGSALCLMEQMRSHQLELRLVSSLPRAALVHYIEAVQYDETPLRTRIVGDGALAKAKGRPPSAALAVQALLPLVDNTLVLREGQSKSLQVSASGAPQKIVQTRGDVGMVIRLGERLVTLSIRPHFPLAVVEDTSATCLRQLQLSLSRVGRAARAFQQVTRAATTDAFSGNKLAEASIGVERALAGQNSSLHVLCDVHGTAGVYDKTFAPLDPFITGVIRTALSLRTGAAMARFRHCLRLEIASRLEVFEGACPREAVDYKERVVKMFVSHGSKVTTRRALLALCPNGDWRAPKVQFYADFRHQFRNRLVVQEHLTSGLVLALASSQPALYNRSKWTGSDIAVDDLGVFEAVHRLLSTTFARFCASFAKGTLAQQKYLKLGAALAAFDAPQPQEQSAEDAIEAEGDADPDANVAQPVEADQKSGDKGADTAGEGGSDVWAQENVKCRRLAMAFLQSRPLGHLVLARLLMEPLRQYMGKQFDRAAEHTTWAARADLADGRLSMPEFLLKSPVVQVALGRDDDFFKAQLSILASRPEMWTVSPPSSHTGLQRALAFRCISRMGCAFQKLIASKHCGYPFQTFRLLADPSLSESVKKAPECLLDQWTKSLRNKYPDMAGEEFTHVLYSVASLLKLDITNIESRHASVRRLLVSRSVQTHPMAFIDLSAQFLCQQFRTSRSWATKHMRRDDGSVPKPMVRRRRKKATAEKKASPKAKKQRNDPGFGGAWRGGFVCSAAGSETARGLT